MQGKTRHESANIKVAKVEMFSCSSKWFELRNKQEYAIS
jgi:hypothetical protein